VIHDKARQTLQRSLAYAKQMGYASKAKKLRAARWTPRTSWGGER